MPERRRVIDWTRIVKWGAIAGAISACLLLIDQLWGMGTTTGYRPLLKIEFDSDNRTEEQIVAELKQQIGLVVDKMTLIEWELLYTKMKTQGVGSLSFAEMQKLCLLTRQLQWNIPECP